MKKILFIILFLSICRIGMCTVLVSGDMDLQGDVTIANGCWELLSETDVTTPISNLTISGLNGDVDDTYKVTYHIVGGAEATCYALINSDQTNGHYGRQNLMAWGTTVSAERDTSEPYMELNYSDDGSTSGILSQNITDGILLLQANSSYGSHSLFTEIHGVTGTTVGALSMKAFAYNQTNNVTSIFFGTSAGAIEVGSNFQLWRKIS